MEELWPSSSDDDQDTLEQCSSESTYRPLWQLLFFLIVRQMFFRVSNTAITFLLRFLKYFVHILGKAFENAQFETFFITVCFCVQVFLQVILLNMWCVLLATLSIILKLY